MTKTFGKTRMKTTLAIQTPSAAKTFHGGLSGVIGWILSLGGAGTYSKFFVSSICTMKSLAKKVRTLNLEL